MAEIPRISNGPIRGPTMDPLTRGGRYMTDAYLLTPNMHRFWNAIGVMGGLFVGRKTMDILVGQKLSGETIHKDAVPFFLRPLHGVLAYDHFSDDPKDRWMKVVDLLVPTLLGGYGGYAGSNFFFHSGNIGNPSRFGSIKAAMKDPMKITLEAAEDASSMQQSKPWRAMSGFASMFGSASGLNLVPGPWNYGSTLGLSFLAVPRNRIIFPGLKWLTNNISSYFPYGPSSMLPRMINYAAHNPDKTPQQLELMSEVIIKSWFGKKISNAQVRAFANEVTAVRDKFLKEGGVPEAMKEKLIKQLNEQFRGAGLEDTFKKIGLNPLDAQIGNTGFMGYVAKLVGQDKELKKTIDAYRKSYLGRHPEDAGKLAQLAAKDASEAAKIASDRTIAGFAGALGLGAFGYSVGHHAQSFDGANDKVNGNGHGVHHHKPIAKQEGNTFSDFVNGKPLEFFDWVTDAFNSPETLGMHRVYCAAGLTFGGIPGMLFSQALTGRKLDGTAIPLEGINPLLRPFYKKMPYNPHSDNLKDRWAMITHVMIPVITGAMGVLMASNGFFTDRKEKVRKAQYIDEFEAKAGTIQAEPWTGLTALGAMLAVPSGAPYLPLPFPNYGATLGTRYTLMSGREVIMPGLGKLWTNNHSRYPLNSPKLLDKMITYAVNNKTKDPEQLGEMAFGVLKPWFENVTDKQVQEFIDKLHSIRDHYLQAGGVPEDYKKQCEQELLTAFKGAGLEKTLAEIGLDPEKAALGNNGLAGTIANILGAQKPLDDMRATYREKVHQRKESWQTEHPSQPQKMADIIPADLAKTHTERVNKQQDIAPDYNLSV